MAHVVTSSVVSQTSSCAQGVARPRQIGLRVDSHSGTKLTPRPAQRRTRRGTPRAPRAGLFDIFTGGAALRSSPQKDELVQELYEAVDGTQAGLTADIATRERITELVEQLSRYSVRSPTRSDLFWGEWEIVYCSKPSAPGGPFRSAPGRALFANQRILQSLQKPDTLINIVEFKTLGLLPGSSRVAAELTILDGQRYQLNLGKAAINVTGAADASKPAAGESGIVRTFRTVYLDDVFRVAEFEPEDEAREPILFVFQRLTTEEQEEEEVEEEEEEEKEAPAATVRGTRRIGREAREPVPEVMAGALRSRGSTPVLSRRGRQQQQEEEEEEETEEGEEEQQSGGLGGFFSGFARARQQADSLTSAAASAASSVGQGTSRAEQQQQRTAVQEGVKEFADAAREAAAEARQLQQALKASERRAGGLQRGAAQDRSRLQRARGAVEAAMEELERAEEEERAASDRAREGAQELKELERVAGGSWW